MTLLICHLFHTCLIEYEGGKSDLFLFGYSVR